MTETETTTETKASEQNGHIPDWETYFMGMAKAASHKSKDPNPNGKVGAVVVSADKLVLSTGFNGLARGVFDDQELLEHADEKLFVICHAVEVLHGAHNGRVQVPSTDWPKCSP